MKNKIYPCIWFDNKANEAVRFYCNTFTNSKIDQQNELVTLFQIDGFRIMALEGGSVFHPNSTMSFYTVCESEEEINGIWKQFAKKGKILMPLGIYPWSTKYGWVEDEYGVSWQLTLGSISDLGQKIAPTLMFNGNQFGKAEEAINLYTSIFTNSEIHFLSRYERRDQTQNGKISHCQFSLLGQRFAAMDSKTSNDFSFSEGNSIVVNCETQVEIDYYWNALTDSGSESRCG